TILTECWSRAFRPDPGERGPSPSITAAVARDEVHDSRFARHDRYALRGRGERRVTREAADRHDVVPRHEIDEGIITGRVGGGGRHGRPVASDADAHVVERQRRDAHVAADLPGLRG